jgi:ABC-type nitrate/sulfonate/bicarbonate transport system substrate-binding protein
MKEIKLALDWTPNSNHIGFYVAAAKGWYREAGIELIIESPSQCYCIGETPARRLVNGEVDLCICPSESLISALTSEVGKIKPKAIATILQHDTSAIVSLASSKIKEVKDLDDKRYASYQGRFEMAIVRQLIQSAGGKGSIIEVDPPKLSCFESVIQNEADYTWIFLGWEGMLASRNGIELNTFLLSDSNIPYGFSPLLMAHPDIMSRENAAILKEFMKITSKGYLFASTNPVEASEMLYNKAEHGSLKALGMPFVVEATNYLASGNHYVDSLHNWGYMEPERWHSFINWLTDNRIITSRDGRVIEKSELSIENMFTNEFLPADV